MFQLPGVVASCPKGKNKIKTDRKLVGLLKKSFRFAPSLFFNEICYVCRDSELFLQDHHVSHVIQILQREPLFTVPTSHAGLLLLVHND